MHVFYLGAPGTMGGADTEMGHTLAVWRQQGIDVTVIPTWAIDAATRRHVESVGCKVVAIGGPEHLNQVPGLPGAIVHSMCNNQLWRAYPALRAMRCRVIWSNCMTFMFPEEPAAIRACGPCDAYHFQSAFQREELEKHLIPLGYNHGMGHLIRGAFAFCSPLLPADGQGARPTDEIPFAPRPHKPGEAFVIGRLARPDPDKWSSATTGPSWPACPTPAAAALAMGWTPATRPQVRPAAALGRDVAPTENPRRRVPRPLPRHAGAQRRGPGELAADRPGGHGRRRADLVCQNAWGWREMIEDGQTGFLTNATRKWPSAWPNSPTTRTCGRR